MIFWIIFLFTLEYGHCCLNELNPNFRRNLKFPANKYKAIPGCGNDTEATFCTDYDEKEKNFNPNIMTSPLQINNGAAYESDTINDGNFVSNFTNRDPLTGKLFYEWS